MPLGGTNTRLRVGIAHCSEFLLDVPSYFAYLSGTEPWFSNVAISFKRHFAVPFGFDRSTTAGIGFPTGSGKISAGVFNRTYSSPGLTRLDKAGKSLACSL